MDETLQQEKKQESEYKNQNEEEGGIRRRLRDRDLLRKRRAEAEEKETNQLESQRKRSRAEYKSGTKKRGRPRKTEPVPQLSVIQEDAAVTQEAPAVIVAPEPSALISDQLSSSLYPILAVEPQPVSFPVAPAPAPVLESVQSSVFAPALTSPTPVNSVLDSFPAPAQDSASLPAQALDAVSAPALFQDYVPAAALAPPSAPPQVETLYTESQGAEVLEQVLIEDLGPDEDEEISPSKDKGADEGLNETLSINVPEQNTLYSVPTLSSPPLPQEYLPGN
ncbi:predicted GPI-anchored protein 58 isoform X2 [Melanotaenia boesemani]|uniref:predicted GPI-anchored protein 58 isoform X2 n=1 Tax=Melanotaenia boesemani TaxID=1250792 RepID=UPI001C04AE80|nr:predicted GPI-anchored protein 58 isoform X2 [Melanotaenia boesemani]